MKKRGLITTILVLGIMLATTLTSYAGSWKQDTVGWWYQEDNGGYPASQWKQINGAWYYFNGYGYMAANAWIDGIYYVGANGAMLTNTTTPDGYRVGADGAWIREQDYSGFLGTFIHEWIEPDTGYGYYTINGFEISKISNGKIYGNYEQSVGVYSSDRADFTSGVSLKNGEFTVNAQYSTQMGVRYEEAGELVHEELVNDYLLKCKLDVLDGMPTIRVRYEGLTLRNRENEEDSFIKRNVKYDGYQYYVVD